MISLRKKLADDNTLIREGDHFVFTKGVEFSSPSTAAAAIHGGVNGWEAWKDETGMKLNELRL